MMYANARPKKSHTSSFAPRRRRWRRHLGGGGGSPSFNISAAYANKRRLISGVGHSHSALCKCQLGDPGLSYYHTKPRRLTDVWMEASTPPHPTPTPHAPTQASRTHLGTENLINQSIYSHKSGQAWIWICKSGNQSISQDQTGQFAQRKMDAALSLLLVVLLPVKRRFDVTAIKRPRTDEELFRSSAQTPPNDATATAG